MPPWAYQVLDSSTVSLVSSRTSAPSAAAAIEARKPATPPPMTSTSVNCWGRRAALKGIRWRRWVNDSNMAGHDSRPGRGSASRGASRRVVSASVGGEQLADEPDGEDAAADVLGDV